MLKIRLARRGATKRPFYHLVVADVRASRDGKFIEKLGYFDPLVAADDPKRLKLNRERIEHWLNCGALPTDRVLRFLDAEGMRKRPPRDNPIKGRLRKKAQAAADAANAAEA